MNVYEDFQSSDPLNRHLNQRGNAHILGTGTLEPSGHALRLANANATSRRMSNAQIDDYQGLPRRRYRWRPPLTLTVCARFSHPAAGPGVQMPLRGTAGFGFWNDPFLMTGTTIRYQLSSPGRVKLKVYNILGQEVKVLVDESKPAGQHMVRWDATDNNGRRVASGLYFYRIQTTHYNATRRMVYLR